MLPVGIVQRNYYPGCILARMITLISRQRLGKSTLCQILAGNRDFGSEKWFTRKNIYVASDVTRAAALRGKAVHEYPERAKSSKIDLEAFKSDISSTIEVHRPLFKPYVIERPRWFDSICTTNKKQYNYDTENMRDFGIDVAITGQRIKNDLFLKEFERIFGAVVWHVKRGMSGGARSKNH
jgi:predicted P-loop ATPase